MITFVLSQAERMKWLSQFRDESYGCSWCTGGKKTHLELSHCCHQRGRRKKLVWSPPPPCGNTHWFRPRQSSQAVKNHFLQTIPLWKQNPTLLDPGWPLIWWLNPPQDCLLSSNSFWCIPVTFYSVCSFFDWCKCIYSVYIYFFLVCWKNIRPGLASRSYTHN